MREALARVDPGAVLAVWRTTAGLSQLDVANLMDGWSQSAVSNIERGTRRTLHDIGEFLRFADAVDMPREALLPLILGRADATLVGGDVNALFEDAGDSGLDRRTFNEMTAGLAASAVLPAIRVTDRVDGSHIRYLQACLDRLRSGYQRVGGGAVLRQALRQFARARAMLDDSTYTETIGRQLLVLTAELGEATGWAAYDSDMQLLARRMYSEAELLAGCAGDAEVTAHAYLNLAQQSTHLARTKQRRGIAREGLRFAQRAADAAHHEQSPRLHTLIALRQALAHAQLGDEIAFRGAITSARREFDRGDHPSDPTWTQFVSESEINGYEAMGRSELGSPARAASLYRVALADETRSPRDRSYYQARLAGVLLAEGDHARAIAEGLVVLPDLGERMTSSKTLHELTSIRAVAEQAAAEEFCARYDQAARVLAG